MEEAHTNYRNISEKQTIRNKNRAEQFKNNDKHSNTGVITRSRSKTGEDIEQPRGHDMSTGMTDDLPDFVPSPLSIDNSPKPAVNSSHNSLLSPVNTSSTPLQRDMSCQTVSQDNNYICVNNSQGLNPIGELVPEPLLGIPDMKDSELSSEVASDELSQHDSSLDETQTVHGCHYQQNGRKHAGRFHQCETCGVFICMWCLMSRFCHKKCRKNQINRSTVYT